LPCALWYSHPAILAQALIMLFCLLLSDIITLQSPKKKTDITNCESKEYNLSQSVLKLKTWPSSCYSFLLIKKLTCGANLCTWFLCKNLSQLWKIECGCSLQLKWKSHTCSADLVFCVFGPVDEKCTISIQEVSGWGTNWHAKMVNVVLNLHEIMQWNADCFFFYKRFHFTRI
jgi:hypothetical protein